MCGEFRDRVVAMMLSVLSGELESCFVCFAARIADEGLACAWKAGTLEIGLLTRPTRRLLCLLHQRLTRERRPRVMIQIASVHEGTALHSYDVRNLGIAVTKSIDGDAGCEVDILPVLDVVYEAA